MSLDIYLEEKGKIVFTSNITHNLTEMAKACGVYFVCWHPKESNAKKAIHITPIIRIGVSLLKDYPNFYRTFDSPNGWGQYKHFLPWLEELLKACEAHPNAKIITRT